MNWKWPKSKKHPDYNPWYIIIRRLIFLPGVIISVLLYITAVALFAGLKEAAATYRKNI